MWSWLGTTERMMKWPLGDLDSTTSLTPQISCGLLSELQFPHLLTETIISKVPFRSNAERRTLYYKMGREK